MSQEFNQFLNNELNPNQKEAVTIHKGPILVIAGAGSGKTRVITSRITNLILNHDVNPEEILALTFTNKAASEMKERVAKHTSDLKNLPFVGTFHSYCLKLLKQYQSFLNLQSFSILDEDDRTKIIKLILSKAGLNKQINAKSVLYQISLIKNQKIVSDPTVEIFEDKTFEQIFIEYEKEKKNSKCLDFDDLLIEVLKAFRTNVDFKKNIQNGIKHVLVDEYQDTNVVQHELLKEIAKSEKDIVVDSICAVGDEDQSIYSWRGATVENILKFKKDFLNTKTIKIEQNYRSVDQILQVANEVIKNNENRNPKKLWSDKKARNRILKITHMSNYKESDAIGHYIKLVKMDTPKDSIAVLYRTHFQSRTIEESLLKNSLTYKIIGGIQFYDRKEIKDILAYLKLIINPFDKVSMLRILNTPSRQLGAKSENILLEQWESNPFLNFYQLVDNVIDQGLFSGNKAQNLKNLKKVLNEVEKEKTISGLMRKLIEEVDYITFLKTEHEGNEAQQKIDNVNEFIRSAEYFEENESNKLSDFLEKIALLQEKMNEQDHSEFDVQLMTLHAAKGLEFDHVIISGIEEGLLPSSRSLSDPDQIEEERRLFYVGITRARERLLLFNSQIRNTFGRSESQIPSRFLSEVPSNLILEHNLSYSSEIQIKNTFGQFLGKTNLISNIETFSSFIPKNKFIKKENNKTFKTAKPQFNSSSFKNSKWKKNNFVSHPIFGTGIIEDVEEKFNGSTILKIKFKNGTAKKLDSKFVSKI